MKRINNNNEINHLYILFIKILWYGLFPDFINILKINLLIVFIKFKVNKIITLKLK